MGGLFDSTLDPISSGCELGGCAFDMSQGTFQERFSQLDRFEKAQQSGRYVGQFIGVSFSAITFWKAATQGATSAALKQGSKEVVKKISCETSVVGNKVTKGGVDQIANRASTLAKEILQPNPLKGTTYTPKVIKDMRLNAKTAQPDFHGFPRLVDNFARFGRVESLFGRDGIRRTKVSLSGGYQGREGCFEWIIEADKTINHRLFVPNQ